MRSCDVFILGSGIAGLTFALELAELRPDISIYICTKGEIKETNTRYAQGGIASVTDLIGDSFENHIWDTLRAGRGLCNEQVVRTIIGSAPEQIARLSRWGVSFDRDSKGNLELGREGGHCRHRILHCRDQTGLSILEALLQKAGEFKNIVFHSRVFVKDLIVKDNRCLGIRYLQSGSEDTGYCYARLTFLATGGSGQVFGTTTNPLIATGDGVAMAMRAGARIHDMSFYQFHPTTLHEGTQNPVFLVSEAVRGFGAHIIDTQGKRFLFTYHPDGELATRDVVSAAILMEFRRGNRVFLDCRHLDTDMFRISFPHIAAHCRKAGYNLSESPVPIRPAAHYQCGGILIDTEGKTSVDHLYANGECACSGLHGANRLASNSLLEAVVIGSRAAANAADRLDHITLPPISYSGTEKPRRITRIKELHLLTEKLRAELQELMYSHYITKATQGQTDGTTCQKLNKIARKTHLLIRKGHSSASLYELRNLVAVAGTML
ncbi:L-aspartate oxidase [Sinomicrobium oceani]|uniref:L-aspartate oxidase n=1 Tax=Sinomicrobium oceani TaxID=1150368 RepID=UPI00227A93E6|nr:L-aspartate oxidase [Sinomicrobium oceani]